MDERMAKQLVVLAGLELVKSGLIARTWGNVSCRVDDKFFAVTPSGRPYETLKPEEIVLCRTEDASYEGYIKPSSEKGIHALVYRTHPDVNFVIHTHQPLASAISAAGIGIMPCRGFQLLGDEVPVASYGLPGTKKLRKNVGAALEHNKGKAVIMAHHGALCFGENYEETFSAAQQLEKACMSFIASSYDVTDGTAAYDEEKLYLNYACAILGKKIETPMKPVPFYSSRRTPEGFILYKDTGITYRLTDDMPQEAALHREIYLKRKDINFICQDTKKGLLAISYTKSPLRPLLDDFAQIVGYSARCSDNSDPENIEKALRGRLGVLVPGNGAVCCAATESDLHAVEIVMEKNAFAQVSSRLFGEGDSISRFDCKLMHFVYTKSYAKKAKNS